MDLLSLPIDVIGGEILTRSFSLRDVIALLSVSKDISSLVREYLRIIQGDGDYNPEARFRVPYSFIQLFPNLESISSDYVIIPETYSDLLSLAHNKKLRRATISVLSLIQRSGKADLRGIKWGSSPPSPDLDQLKVRKDSRYTYLTTFLLSSFLIERLSVEDGKNPWEFNLQLIIITQNSLSMSRNLQYEKKLLLENILKKGQGGFLEYYRGREFNWSEKILSEFPNLKSIEWINVLRF